MRITPSIHLCDQCFIMSVRKILEWTLWTCSKSTIESFRMHIVHIALYCVISHLAFSCFSHIVLLFLDTVWKLCKTNKSIKKTGGRTAWDCRIRRTIYIVPQEKSWKTNFSLYCSSVRTKSSLGPLLKCHLVHIYATWKISVYSADFNFKKSLIQAKACLETWILLLWYIPLWNYSHHLETSTDLAKNMSSTLAHMVTLKGQ